MTDFDMQFEKQWFAVLEKSAIARGGAVAASVIYGFGTSIRNFLYDQQWLPVHKVDCPVISVGNISAGGNAKTPLISYLAKILTKEGCRPVVLSRGYGGKTAGPHKVTDQDSAEIVGDEPCMLHRLHGHAVVVARDRVAGAQFILREGLGDIILLDDGLQHRRLHRDLEIITANAGDENAVREFCQKKILPAGRNRESHDKALARADMIVFASRHSNGFDNIPLDTLRRAIPESLPVSCSEVKFERVESLDGSCQLVPQKIVAVCGIANPDGFRATLERSGYEVLCLECLPDHGEITLNMIKSLRAKYPGVPIVCTEKDAVKMEPSIFQDVSVCRVDFHIEPESEFLKKVMQAVDRDLTSLYQGVAESQ